MLTQCTYEPPRNIVKIQIPGPQLEILIQQFFKEEAKICVFNQLLREFIKKKNKTLREMLSGLLQQIRTSPFSGHLRLCREGRRNSMISKSWDYPGPPKPLPCQMSAFRDGIKNPCKQIIQDF